MIRDIANVHNTSVQNYRIAHILTNIIFLITNIMLVIDFAFPNIKFQFVVEIGLLLITFINIPLILSIYLNKRDVLMISVVFSITVILLVYKLIFMEVSLVEIKYIATSLFIFLIFTKINIENKVYDILSVTILIGAVIIVLSKQGDYSLGSYFYSEKNSFAPLLLIITVWIIASYKKNPPIKKIISIAFVIFVVCLLGLIQSRLNLIGVLVLLIVTLMGYMFKKRITKKVILAIITVVPIVSTLLYYLFHTSVFKKVVLREDYLQFVNGSNLFDKVTSGRLTSTINNLAFFRDSPLLGTRFKLEMIINDPNSAVGIHSIWLRFLSYGGLILFVLFFFLIVVLVIKIVKENQNRILALCLLTVGLINSLGEPYAPFGPSSSYFIYWSLLGLSIRRVI